MLFRWIAVPWLQAELDIHTRSLNNTKKRAMRHKVLPQNRTPKDIFMVPSLSGVEDFKVRFVFEAATHF